MGLFWVVKKVRGERQFFIQPAAHKVEARLKSTSAGFDGEFEECFQIDTKTQERVPGDAVGRVLSFREARDIIEELSVAAD